MLARDAEAIVVRRADRVDDGVIALEQLATGDVGAELDAAVEAEPGLQRRLVVHTRDRLDLRVVGSDARPNQSERGRAERRSGRPQTPLRAVGRSRRSRTVRRRSRRREVGIDGGHAEALKVSRRRAWLIASAAARPSEIAWATRLGTSASPMTRTFEFAGTSELPVARATLAHHDDRIDREDLGLPRERVAELGSTFGQRLQRGQGTDFDRGAAESSPAAAPGPPAADLSRRPLRA